MATGSRERVLDSFKTELYQTDKIQIRPDLNTKVDRHGKTDLY